MTNVSLCYSTVASLIERVRSIYKLVQSLCDQWASSVRSKKKPGKNELLDKVPGMGRGIGGAAKVDGGGKDSTGGGGTGGDTSSTVADAAPGKKITLRDLKEYIAKEAQEVRDAAAKIEHHASSKDASTTEGICGHNKHAI